MLNTFVYLLVARKTLIWVESRKCVGAKQHASPTHVVKEIGLYCLNHIHIIVSAVVLLGSNKLPKRLMETSNTVRLLSCLEYDKTDWYIYRYAFEIYLAKVFNITNKKWWSIQAHFVRYFSSKKFIGEVELIYRHAARSMWSMLPTNCIWAHNIIDCVRSSRHQNMHYHNFTTADNYLRKHCAHH